MTGADIKNLVNQAALKAVKENRNVINEQDIDYSFDRMKLGLRFSKDNLDMSKEDLKT